MSAYEQRIEPPDKKWQYLLFAAEPYETISFKVSLRVNGHTMERLVAPLNKSATFFQAEWPLNIQKKKKKERKRITTQIVHKEIVFMLIFEWIN